MRKYDIGKMKTLLVAILMIASVIVVLDISEKVEAAPGETDLQGVISNIHIVGWETNGFGSGVVNITWDSTVDCTNSTYPVEYNVTFCRQQATDGIIWTNGGGNRSANGGNSTYYLWNTTSKWVPDGEWWVNVTASIYNGVQHELYWLSGSSTKITVRNTLPGTPGVDLFQGGRYWLYNDSELLGNNYNEVIGSVTNGSLTYNNIVDIALNSSLAWGGSATGQKYYYLYRPYYNGSKSETAYNLSWARYSSTPGKYWLTGGGADGYKISSITLDRAGLWLIADNDHGAWITSRAMENIEEYNSTIWAWFWVNTSTDFVTTYTGISNDEFDFNASGTLSMAVTQGTNAVTDVSVDFTNETNEVSVKSEVQWTTTGTETWYLNKTYFQGVGNFTGRAYKDRDYVTTTNGLQYYTENVMDSGTAGWKHFNDTYGANSAKNGSASWLSTATRYNWSTCGPWDPPEQNATFNPVRVKTGTPYTAVTENTTVYYGFDGTVNVTLRESSGGSAIDTADVDISILDDDDVNVTANFTIFDSTGGDSAGTQRVLAGPGQEKCGGRVTIFKTGGKAGWILINMTNWGRNNTLIGRGNKIGDNGTWKIEIQADYGTDRELNGDGNNKQWTEEWNKTVTWKVKSGPKAQWKWVDDDGSIWGDANTDGVIPYIPNASDVPVNIEFKVYDSGGNAFGDLTSGQSSGMCESVKQCAANISITGNSLFTGSLSSFPGFAASWYSAGIWTVPIIPTMSVGGGSFTVKVTAYNSSVLETVSIGGTNYELNGSVVTVTPNEFMIDVENKTLQVRVQYAGNGDDMQALSGDTNARGVSLYYIDDTYDGTAGADWGINAPIVDHTVAMTTIYSGGFYTIPFNTTQQMFNQTTGLNGIEGAGFDDIMAPRNLTIFVDGPGRRDGYALIQMKPVNDLEVHLEGSSEYTMMSGYEYDDFTISCDFVGNSTATPSAKIADKNNFHYKIVDIYGEDVTGTSNTDALLYNIYGGTSSRVTGNYVYSYDHDGVYGLDAGTYYVYAKNNTHNSEGNNATLHIQAVDVTCDKAPLIWMSDKNISATFTITYDGSPVNGTLVIDNMSDVGAYNKTWTNCSFGGSSDVGGNNSIEIDETLITNGVITVNDITPDKLHPNLAYQYITFWFKPSASPGAFARAKARIKVEVPTVTPDPVYIPLGKTTKVYCTATGRGETLSDVFIRLHGQGFDQNSTSDVDGRVAFSVTPSTTGNISIDVGAEGRTLADTVVKVVAWVIDASTDAEVNEGNEFTVTAIKEGTTDAVVGAAITITGIGTAVTDANGQATFTAPQVTSDRTYTIKVTAEGYAPDPDGLTITVINIPKLILVLPEADKNGDHVAASAKFVIAVADDTGSAIVGAMIAFDGKTYTTGVGGIATITASKTKGSYPIEVTFGNYVPAADTVNVGPVPPIPGFELLSLIAALGVAFIILRRRRK